MIQAAKIIGLVLLTPVLLGAVVSCLIFRPKYTMNKLKGVGHAKG